MPLSLNYTLFSKECLSQDGIQILIWPHNMLAFWRLYQINTHYLKTCIWILNDIFGVVATNELKDKGLKDFGCKRQTKWNIYYGSCFAFNGTAIGAIFAEINLYTLCFHVYHILWRPTCAGQHFKVIFPIVHPFFNASARDSIMFSTCDSIKALFIIPLIAISLNSATCLFGTLFYSENNWKGQLIFRIFKVWGCSKSRIRVNSLDDNTNVFNSIG